MADLFKADLIRRRGLQRVAGRGLQRGFVAAPLIGALVFFIAIVFVVNVSKSEAGEVVQITSDAYHNRLVSVMEIYRTDLGAVFVENLGRTVEGFIATPCWSTPPLGITYPSSEYANESAARYAGCVDFNLIINAVIQSTDPKYGAHNWFKILNENRSYEGLAFGPANPASFEAFLSGLSGVIYMPEGGGVGGYDIAEATGLIRTLIQGSVFDCFAFAYGAGDVATTASPEPPVFQCCTVQDDPANPRSCQERGGVVKPGCESGVFYIAVKIEEANVFRNMPRIFMDDGAGNVIRSGAIADRDIFVPVNYPLFRYYDDAFKFYRVLAYGKDGPGGVEKGVVEGFCHGPNCAGLNVSGLAYHGHDTRRKIKEVEVEESPKKLWVEPESEEPVGYIETTSAEEIQRDTAEVFVETVVYDAAENVSNAPDRNYKILFETKNLTDPNLWEEVQPGETGACEGEFRCAYYSSPSFQVEFIDLAPEYRTSPEENKYCWHAKPEFTPTQPT